jgi:hypothetical protein
MKINRRQTILGGTSLAISTSIAGSAKAQTHYPATVIMENVHRELEYTSLPESMKNYIIALNEIFIDRHQDLFNDPELYMTGPVSLYKNTTIEAKSRMFFYTHSDEVDSKENLIKMVDTIYNGIKTEPCIWLDHPENYGVKLHPYIPITSFRFGFITRYGTSRSNAPVNLNEKI